MSASSPFQLRWSRHLFRRVRICEQRSTDQREDARIAAAALSRADENGGLAVRQRILAPVRRVEAPRFLRSKRKDASESERGDDGEAPPLSVRRTGSGELPGISGLRRPKIPP